MKKQLFFLIPLLLIFFRVSAQQQVRVEDMDYSSINGDYTLTEDTGNHQVYSQNGGSYSFEGSRNGSSWDWSFNVYDYTCGGGGGGMGPLFNGNSNNTDPSGISWWCNAPCGYFQSPNILNLTPSVTTSAADQVIYFTAILGGVVNNQGEDVVTSHGVKWGTALDLLNNDVPITDIDINPFSQLVESFTPGTTYYFRAYAINSKGTGYGEILSFTTPTQIPVVATIDASAVSYFSATLAGDITNEGTDPVTSMGINWGTTSDNLTNKVLIDQGVGSFSQSVTGFDPNTTYYFQAYAKNAKGTAYGNTLSFTTLIAKPVVATVAAGAVSFFSTSLGGSITSQGAASVSSRGIKWGTALDNLANEVPIGTGVGTFSQSVTGLDPNTTYYFRAYAVNDYGTAYGNTLSFTTLIATPGIKTIAASKTGLNSVTLGGTITSTGASAITSNGVAFGTSPNPVTKTESGSVSGTFNIDFNGLTVGTQYYYRAFATNSYGTNYGDDGKFVLTNVPAGNGLSMDGLIDVNDYISLPPGVYFDDNTFTVEAWVYVRSLDNWSRLFDFGTGSSNDNVLLALTAGVNGPPVFSIYNGPSAYQSQYAASVQMTLNQWTHIACVLNGSTGTVYMNGIKTMEMKFNAPKNLMRQNNYIGKSNWDGDANSNFTLDEFHIWKTARTQADIQSDMVFGVNPSNADLELDLNFNQGLAGGDNSGLTTIIDQTGSGIIGTLNNFALTGTGSNYVESYAMVIPTSTAPTNNYSLGFTANWKAPVNGTVEKYYLDVATDNAFLSKVSGYSIKDVGNVNTFAITGLSAGTTYYYRVCAYKDAAGMGAWSNTISATVTTASLRTVTTATESGTGSLKQCILDAVAGDCINFDVATMGTNTILLTSPVVIEKDLTIQGAAGGIILNGNNVTRVMTNSHGSTTRLENLMIQNGNDKALYVGGVKNEGKLTMVNCVVSGNTAIGSGAVGGVLSYDNAPTDGDVLNLINTTIAGNTGDPLDGAGGLYSEDEVNIYNSIIYGNSGGAWSDVDETINSISKSYSSLYGNDVSAKITAGTGNLYGVNPKFSGGTTHPYSICGNSDAVDAGNNSYSFETTDLRGTTRKLSKIDGTAGTIDMGAYEWTFGTDPILFTWDGSESEDWNTPANWDLNQVPTSKDVIRVPNKVNKPKVGTLSVTSGGALTIDPSSSLTLTGAISNEGRIIIKSDATGTGSLITGGASGAGFALVERYMSNDEWHIVSSPTGTQKINDFIADNTCIPYIPASGLLPDRYGMMDYDPAHDKWNDYFTSTNRSELGIGKGYMVRVMDPVRNLRFQGVINATTTTSVSKGWNCIGNPFTSAININALAGSGNFMTTNASAFESGFGGLYFWNQGSNKYDEINNVSAYQAAVGQGFFMKVKEGVGSVSFTSAMQVHKLDATFKKAVTEYPSIKLMAQAGTKSFSTDIKFIEGTTKGLDFGYDAGLFTTDKSLTLYTKLVEDNGIQFQLQCLPPTGYDKMVIPVGIDCKTGGEVVFSVETVNLDPACKTILEDKLTSTFTDLSKGSYKVAVVANTSTSDRFFLHTSDIVSGLEDQVLPGKLTAYAVRNIEIHVAGEVGDNAIATMFNGLGQVVLTKKLGAGNLNIIGLPNLSSGVYILSIIDKGITQTMKVMVRK